jgi:hypothetical protein
MVGMKQSPGHQNIIPEKNRMLAMQIDPSMDCYWERNSK